MSKLRHTETAARQGTLIRSIIDDLERTIQILHVDIGAEEERARVFDRADPLYPILARTFRTRRKNLKVTIAELKHRLTSLDPNEEVGKAA